MTQVENPGNATGAKSQPAMALASAIYRERYNLAKLLLPQLLSNWGKFASISDGSSSDIEEFIRRELYVFPDYLRLYFHTGEVDYKHLYIGEKRKQLFDPSLLPEKRAELEEQILKADESALRTHLSGLVDGQAIALLEPVIDLRHMPA